MIVAKKEGSCGSPKEATLKRELDEAPRKKIIDEATEKKANEAAKNIREKRAAYAKKATEASEDTAPAPPWELKRPKKERSSGSTEKLRKKEEETLVMRK